MKEDKKSLNRREFLGSAAAAGALGALGVGALSASCSSEKTAAVKQLTFLDQAPDGKALKAGLIGCGGRGRGAAVNFLSAGNGLEVVALADVFKDRIEETRAYIKKEKNVEVADEKCFLGFDAYEKVIDSGVDILIIATPPHFRPEHFAAGVNARKHIFMEKPVAVDPVGARSIMSSSKKAEAAGLCVGTGTQRRHQRDYVSTYEHIKAGEIGEIVSANCYWNQSQLWYKNHEKGWSDMEWMIRDWVNWTWLSGDHIVEQHVHNIDVVNWFTGKHPVSAVGFGSRQRRVTGDSYDFFSIDFTYEGGMHVHSMCRQIDGCTGNVSEFVMGTKGSSNCKNEIKKPDGTEAWKYEYPLNDKGEKTKRVKVSPYVQEHIDLVTAIRTNNPYVEAENTAISTMAAIMGRISSYTGKKVTWEEMMNSSLRLGPAEYKLGKMDMKAVIPVPGSAKKKKG